MTRWRRRASVAAALLLTLLIARAGYVLWPPALRVAPPWSVLSGVTVINPGRDRRENQTVVMRDGRIESIGNPPANLRVRPRNRLYENRYVLPGLIDLDVQVPATGHLQRLFGILFLYSGVTTVRDVGNFGVGIRDLQQRIAAGAFPWPRLVACGQILEGDPPACAGSRVVRNGNEARRAVAELTAAGAGCVAVQHTLSAEALAAARAAASAAGVPLVGDVPDGVWPNDAGMDDVHLISAAPVGRRGGDSIRSWQAVDAAAIDAFARSAAARGAAFTPNLLRWSQLTYADAALRQTPFIEFLPRFYRDALWPSESAGVRAALGDAAGSTEPALHAAQTLAAMQLAVRTLSQAGARIHVGSGTPSAYIAPGVGLWFEMQRLVGVGIPLEDVWVAATRGAGAAVGIPQLGVLEDGAPADLLIFGKDPTRDIDALMSLEAVVTQGRLYPRTILNRYFLEYARYVGGALYDRLSMLAVRSMAWRGRALRSACTFP